MRIAIDIDGVLADTCAWTCAEAARLGVPLTERDLATYRLEDNAAVPAAIAARILERFNGGAGMREVAAYPGLIAAFRGAAASHRVVVVTSRPARAREATVSWLDEHGLGRCPVLFTGAPHKQDIAGLFDVLIDDDSTACSAFVTSDATRQAFLIDRPYNTAFHHARVTRAAGLAIALGSLGIRPAG